MVAETCSLRCARRVPPGGRPASYRAVDFLGPASTAGDIDVHETAVRSFSRIRQRVLRAAIDRGATGSLDALDSDLRAFSLKRHDQRATSTCVAQSTTKSLEIKRVQKYGPDAHVDLSVEGLYYLARELMVPPETANDDGTYISTAVDALRRFGICTAADWPFDPDVNPDRLFTPPSWLAMRHAFLHKITDWHEIDSFGADRVSDVIASLAAGNPVIFGTAVGENWQRYKAGEILGRVAAGDVKGRHATVLVGWDHTRGVFLDENSWSKEWGDEGFCQIAPEVIGGAETDSVHVMTGGWEEWKAAA